MEQRQQEQVQENETEKQLTNTAKVNVVYAKVTDPVFLTDAGYVTITLDDGPSGYTDDLLEILSEKRARAIFFMLGENVEKHRSVVREVVAAGHVIGNHSYTHPNFSKISLEQARDEIQRTSNIIAEVTGTRPPYFRPPYGAFNEKTLLLATQEQMKVVMWSADPKDYIFNTGNAVFNATNALLASRKILLLHDLKQATVNALPRIIDTIREKELEITTAYEQ